MSTRNLTLCACLCAFCSIPALAQNDDADNVAIDRSVNRTGLNDLMDIDAPSSAARDGFWSVDARWPIAPIHAAMLPNGQVLTYGTNQQADGGSGFVYDRWTPGRGLSPNSHRVFNVQTNNNIFCSAQTLLPGTGGLMLVTGGSVEKNGRRNFGTTDVNVFDYRDNRFFKPYDPMKFARWYPTVTQLADGRVLVSGGRDEKRFPQTTPEYFDPGTGKWTALPGAKSGLWENNGWNYPRQFMAPNGKVLVMAPNRSGIHWFNTAGNGRLTKARDMSVRPGPNAMMAVMYEDSKILSIRKRDARVLTLQQNDTVPSKNTTDIATHRYWADATLLPNGEVLITGGARENQRENQAIKYVEIWNPKTQKFRRGASGNKSRLYHSVSLLLWNGTVLVAGGGPPGPIANLNAEIYYPPYLFTSSGNLRTRPRILGFDEDGGSVIRIRARGDEGNERMVLSINGKEVQAYSVDKEWQSYYYTTTVPVTGDQVRVAFTNDLFNRDQGINRNLKVDYVEIDGAKHQSEDVRTFAKIGSASGFQREDLLSRNGYFDYFNSRLTPRQFGRIRYGQTVTFKADREGTLKEARLIRLGSVTHSFDMGQRGMTLPIEKTSTTFTVKIPSIRKSIPPGHYMLFVVNTVGTPSNGAMIEIY